MTIMSSLLHNQKDIDNVTFIENNPRPHDKRDSQSIASQLSYPKIITT